jgi:hypothetical protein
MTAGQRAPSTHPARATFQLSAFAAAGLQPRFELLSRLAQRLRSRPRSPTIGFSLAGKVEHGIRRPNFVRFVR